MAKVIGPGSVLVDVTGFAPHLPVAGETVRGTALRFVSCGRCNICQSGKDYSSCKETRSMGTVNY